MVLVLSSSGKALLVFTLVLFTTKTVTIFSPTRSQTVAGVTTCMVAIWSSARTIRKLCSFGQKGPKQRPFDSTLFHLHLIRKHPIQPKEYLSPPCWRRTGLAIFTYLLSPYWSSFVYHQNSVKLLPATPKTYLNLLCSLQLPPVAVFTQFKIIASNRNCFFELLSKCKSSRYNGTIALYCL